MILQICNDKSFLPGRKDEDDASAQKDSPVAPVSENTYIVTGFYVQLAIYKTFHMHTMALNLTPKIILKSMWFYISCTNICQYQNVYSKVWKTYDDIILNVEDACKT